MSLERSTMTQPSRQRIATPQCTREVHDDATDPAAESKNRIPAPKPVSSVPLIETNGAERSATSLAHQRATFRSQTIGNDRVGRRFEPEPRQLSAPEEIDLVCASHEGLVKPPDRTPCPLGEPAVRSDGVWQEAQRA